MHKLCTMISWLFLEGTKPPHLGIVFLFGVTLPDPASNALLRRLIGFGQAITLQPTGH